MHREIAADAVSGAVLEIEAGLPEILPRETVELRAGGAVGKHRAGNRDVPAKHAGETVAHFRRRLADRNRAGHVGGAVFILGAGIDQQQIAGRNAPVALAGDAVVHDGAVRAGAGDGRERNILQRAGLPPEGLQRLDGVDFRQRARGRFAIDPGKEAHQRHGVALVRRSGALDLGDVLHRLEQAHRVVAAHRLAAGGGDQAAQRVRRGRAVEGDRSAAAREFRQRRRQRVGLPDIGRPFEMVAGQVRELAVIDEHGGTAVLRHQRVGQRQRRVRDVGAADVEGPGHRVAVRQHQRIDAELADFQPDPLQLLGFDLAGKLRAVNGDGAERRSRALGPDRIQRVALDRDQFRAGLGAGGGQPLGCRRSVQPRVKTEAVAGRKMPRQPVFRGRIGQRLDMPGLAVDLFGGLQRIASVDEDGGLMDQDHRPCRPSR